MLPSSQLHVRSMEKKAIRTTHQAIETTRCTHSAGKGIWKISAKSSASCLAEAAFCSKVRRASCKCVGGPLSRNWRVGGRNRSMSDIFVTRDNITYEFNHQSLSDIVRAPSSFRAQSIVTPARSVWPWEAVVLLPFIDSARPMGQGP